MIRHPSFGRVPKEEFDKAKIAPHGKSVEILRKYEPAFGAGNDVKIFQAIVSLEVTRTDKALITVVAASEEEACSIINDKTESDFDWDEGFDNTGFISIDKIEEI